MKKEIAHEEVALAKENAAQHELQHELQALIGDAEKLLQHATTLAGEHADELRKQIQLNLKRARESLGTSEEVIREQADEIQRASASYIKKNPLQAIGIAAGVGLLIGLLLGQRHHDE